MPETVKAKVVNGWITLEGTVARQYQKLAAERAVRYLTGVKGVSNAVAVTPPFVSTNVSHKIKDALRRVAEKEAEHIMVDVHEGRVTLKGTVHSLTERRAAEYAAWAAPGVTIVDDKLVVQS